ncbi:PA2169 family four-helix-bundle protein [Luteolibacter flavescens]|uniref:PA2169 family four-helix-bundle protein n=1 Tax=Luteolibacter flavescens TaxID=1859460 RepID=A0ABT3FNE3_9BACT|nr:PA2169 family four-helix-bundle protein [Luteolibacter flavescens]MCW1885088.1 PA2169 family four-helix-bundle protein [Luteolibacter flavescens]
MKTTTRPNPEAASLQDILTRLNDSIDGFRLAADFSTDSAFIRLCERSAETREAMVEELAAVIAECGMEPSLEGSREASVHRAWIRFVCQVHPQFRKRLRAECERGEKEFQRTLEGRNRPAARSERTGNMLSDLSAHVATTLSALRRVETASRTKAQPHYAAAA